MGDGDVVMDEIEHTRVTIEYLAVRILGGYSFEMRQSLVAQGYDPTQMAVSEALMLRTFARMITQADIDRARAVAEAINKLASVISR